MRNQITVTYPAHTRRDLKCELQQLRDEYHINTSHFGRRLIQDGIDEFRLKKGVVLR